MSNFTRSILYSSAVMVLGLVAVMAIYSNGQSTAEGLAIMEPASGEEVSTITHDDAVTTEIRSAAEEAAHAEAVENAIPETTQEISLKKVTDAIAEATANAEDAIPAVETPSVADLADDVVEATTETVSNTVETTQDAVSDAVENATNAVTETATEAATEAASELAPAAGSVVQDTAVEAITNEVKDAIPTIGFPGASN